MKMASARAAFRDEHMRHVVVEGDDGKAVGTRRERALGSPSFRRWARERFRGKGKMEHVGELSPKLHHIVVEPGRLF